MRASREKAAESRQRVIDVASRLYRENGFDGIGLRDLMESAGMTQGAFYKQFSSKEDLVSEASARALEEINRRTLMMVATNPDDPLGAIMAYFLSETHRDDVQNGCAIVALNSDAARQPPEIKASFEAGVNAQLGVLESVLFTTGSRDARDKAVAVYSAMVGALVLSRLVNDQVLSKAFLDAAVKQVRRISSTS
ncbi:TetR/AcrR family transcriptional regulator [Mesorhizobium sp. 2RAF21]|uniref:TetR/AcrR family transcriptional regulator n=1 Tax=Mesorhizobium sp. 2RAF21 TaxID=3232995 RepID=UPI003F97CE88